MLYFFTRFACEKIPQINFSGQYFHVIVLSTRDNVIFSFSFSEFMIFFMSKVTKYQSNSYSKSFSISNYRLETSSKSSKYIR